MRTKAIFGIIAAALMVFVGTAPALAVDDTTTVNVTITAGTQFSVDITSASSSFPSDPFALGYNSCNWGCMAYYTYTVTDLRGTAKGWNVNASASNFVGGPGNIAVPGANLFRSNELSQNPTGFTAAAGSISAGVSVGAQDSPTLIMNTSSLIISGASGLSGPSPKASGAFSAKESMWYTFPDSVAAGSYNSTLTLTLTSAIP